jgi:hypothetical protein
MEKAIQVKKMRLKLDRFIYITCMHVYENKYHKSLFNKHYDHLTNLIFTLKE